MIAGTKHYASNADSVGCTFLKTPFLEIRPSRLARCLLKFERPAPKLENNKPCLVSNFLKGQQ